MKKMIFLLGILMLTSITYGQPSVGKEAYGAYYSYLNPPAFMEYQLNPITDKDELVKQYYAFHNESGVLYLVSYEDKFSEPFCAYEMPSDGDKNIVSIFASAKCHYEKPDHMIYRNLYLYRYINGKFTIACDKPLQVDHYYYKSYTAYFPHPYYGDDWRIELEGSNNGSVTINPDRSVTIVLLNYFESKWDEAGMNIDYANKTINLKPNNDGTYNVVN